MGDVCPVCAESAENRVRIIKDPKGKDLFYIECATCEKFSITRTALSALAQTPEKYGPRHLLSGAIRNIYESSGPPQLDSANLKSLLDSVSVPQDPLQYCELLLKHCCRMTGKLGKSVDLLMDHDHSLVFASDADDFRYIIDSTRKLGWIEPGRDNKGYSVSLDGWRKFAELRKKQIRSNKAFVAMWFDKSLNKAWRDGFKVALVDRGFDPVRIDLKEHNEKICDRIIAEIRSSGLLVADFTGQRGGVYFEAGFAMGLGIPVIWTCREDDVGKLHFDTRQYNHIVWKTPSELKKKLLNRIKATLPKR